MLNVRGRPEPWPSSPGRGFASTGQRTHGEDQNGILIFTNPGQSLGIHYYREVTPLLAYKNPDPQCLEKQVTPKGNQP